MNKIRLSIIAVLIAISSGVQAQDLSTVNQWSIGLNLGGHEALVPVKTSTKFLTHVGGDIRYMVNNRFGLMGDIGFENFDWKTDSTNSTNLIRLSLQGVVNLGDILRFDTWTDRFGLLFHTGGGISNMWQKDAFSFGKGDVMGHFISGIRPQFKVTDRVAINADLSTIFNVDQDRNFDFKSKNTIKDNGINGFYMTASVGVSIALGKNDRHADWVPSEFGGGNTTDPNLEKRVKELEGLLIDTDKDGVPDTRDNENNTPEGSVVNSLGEAVKIAKDSDNDGILDEFDACPNQKGTFSGNGCPDSDGDGIVDSKDKCPNVAGPMSNNGCEVIEKEVEEVLKEALHGIKFETGNSVIKSSSFPILGKVVGIMKTHPNYFLEIHGHADASGDAAKNLELTNRRADAVLNYITQKGIAANRMKAFGHGDKIPVASNDTAAGRADNRRVEFVVVPK